MPTAEQTQNDMIERDKASWEASLRDAASKAGVAYDPTDLDGMIRQVSYAKNAGVDPRVFFDQQNAIYGQRGTNVAGQDHYIDARTPQGQAAKSAYEATPAAQRRQPGRVDPTSSSYNGGWGGTTRPNVPTSQGTLGAILAGTVGDPNAAPAGGQAGQVVVGYDNNGQPIYGPPSDYNRPWGDRG